MGKNARRASLSAQQRIACAEAECPTTHIEGKLFVNATVLTLTPAKGSRIETRYTLKDGKLELKWRAKETADTISVEGAAAAIAKLVADERAKYQ